MIYFVQPLNRTHKIASDTGSNTTDSTHRRFHPVRFDGYISQAFAYLDASWTIFGEKKTGKTLKLTAKNSPGKWMVFWPG